MWTISSLEAGSFSFLVTALSPEPDSKKRVADYLLMEGREGGQEREKEQSRTAPWERHPRANAHRIWRHWLGWGPKRQRKCSGQRHRETEGFGISKDIDMQLEQGRDGQ